VFGPLQLGPNIVTVTPCVTFGGARGAQPLENCLTKRRTFGISSCCGPLKMDQKKLAKKKYDYCEEIRLSHNVLVVSIYDGHASDD
jgi:hypothetical protein